MRLLLIGRLNGQLKLAADMAKDAGARVAHAETALLGLETLRSRGGDLVMADVEAGVPALIEAMRAERIMTDVVACGIGSDAKAAADAIRAGAKEYVPLPPDADLIAAVIAAVAEEDGRDLVWRDPAMGKVLDLARTVAASEASVLITGESGTGKEVVARFVHKNSKRSGRPFVALNCAAIPENLLESELFGHEKGAFTGALARRIGRFEEADGGTLLLDEISEMDVRLQAKLLRVIQERMIDRVGGTRPVPVDIRILATSNRDLTEAVRKGEFREDLLFRLNVVNLKLPSLKDRPADVKALAEHFAAHFADLNGVPARPLGEEALRALLAHGWPGNVRELENTMHRAVLLAGGEEIGAEAIVLPDGSRAGAAPAIGGTAVPGDGPQAAGLPVGRTVAEVEQDLILGTLKHTLGNRTHAASILGISIRTLRNKLNDYTKQGVSVPAPGLAGEKAA